MLEKRTPLELMGAEIVPGEGTEDGNAADPRPEPLSPVEDPASPEARPALPAE